MMPPPQYFEEVTPAHLSPVPGNRTVCRKWQMQASLFKPLRAKFSSPVLILIIALQYCTVIIEMFREKEEEIQEVQVSRHQLKVSPTQ